MSGKENEMVNNAPNKVIHWNVLKLNRWIVNLEFRAEWKKKERSRPGDQEKENERERGWDGEWSIEPQT